MKILIISIFSLGLLVHNAQAQTAHNVKLEVILTEDGARRSPIVKDADRVFYRQVFVIEDGFYGKIYLGTRSRQLAWLKRYLFDNEYISGDFAAKIEEMAALLKVVPHIINGNIEIAVTPILLCIAGGLEHDVELKRLSTVNIIPKKKTLLLNAERLQKEFYGSFFTTDDGKSIGVTLVPSLLEYGQPVE